MTTPTTETRRPYFVYAFFGVLALLMIGWLAVNAVNGEEWATIRQGETERHVLEVADNVLERAHGLAGTTLADLGDAEGMLFIFSDAAPRTFTMKGMEYNLDFIWIHNGKIVQIDRNVPTPVGDAEPLTVTSGPLAVDMVVEVPAGKVNAYGYLVGHALTVELGK